MTMPYHHDKNRSCERTDEVLEAYKHRALTAEGKLLEVIKILREMYEVQLKTDEEGGREVAAWYYLGQLEAATGAVLTPGDDP
jgi:hypothetical protein